MTLRGKHAFITGSPRGIGRGIALKLAENGAKVGVHYDQHESAAKDTLEGVRKLGSDGFILQGKYLSAGPNFVAMIALSRRPFGFLPRNSSLCPAP